MSGWRLPRPIAASFADAVRVGRGRSPSRIPVSHGRAPAVTTASAQSLRRRSLGVAAEHAELVAFRIGEDDPARAVGTSAIGDLRCPEATNTFDLLVAPPVSGREVQVQAVLHRLDVRDLDEQKSVPGPRVDDHALLVAWLVRVARPVGVGQDALPPLPQGEGVSAGDGWERDAAGHWPKLRVR